MKEFMMYRFLLSCFGLTAFLCSAAHAGIIGPNYSADNVGYTFTDISGTGTQQIADGLVDDVFQGPLTIGFDFKFYGAMYSNLYITENGLISFNAGFKVKDNANLNSAPLSPNVPVIATYWDDLMTYNSGVYTKTIGAVGFRQYIVQWDSVTHFDDPGTGDARFQAILFEETGNILFNYANTNFLNPTFDNGASATIGLRDADGQTTGNNLQWSFNGAPSSGATAVTSSSSILWTNTSAVAAVPEPSSIALLSLGALGMAIRWRRRAKKHQNA